MLFWNFFFHTIFVDLVNEEHLITFLDQRDKIVICYNFSRHPSGEWDFIYMLLELLFGRTLNSLISLHFVVYITNSIQNVYRKSRPIQEDLNTPIRNH
jgi:hypothetical protein